MAGICEHVQYKPKLWLEKMEMLSNDSEGGARVQIGQIRKTHNSEQRGANSPSHIVTLWINVIQPSKETLLRLPLPAGWIYNCSCLFEYSWEERRCAHEAVQRRVSPTSVQYLRDSFWFTYCNSASAGRQQMFPSRLVRLCSIMKQPLNGEPPVCWWDYVCAFV